jgi:hypothetical protein
MWVQLLSATLRIESGRWLMIWNEPETRLLTARCIKEPIPPRIEHRRGNMVTIKVSGTCQEPLLRQYNYAGLTLIDNVALSPIPEPATPFLTPLMGCPGLYVTRVPDPSDMFRLSHCAEERDISASIFWKRLRNAEPSSSPRAIAAAAPTPDLIGLKTWMGFHPPSTG